MVRYLEAFGLSFTVPDPYCVESAAADCRMVCANIDDARARLRALGSPESSALWSGQAAAEFATRIGSLPDQLDQAWQSYSTVAAAMSDYAANLGPVVSALVALASQAQDAEGTLQAVALARQQAIEQGMDPVSTGWDARLRDAQAAVADLRTRFSALTGEMRVLAGECVQRIRQAQHESIHRDWLDTVGHDIALGAKSVASFGEKTWYVAAGIADELVLQPFTDMPHDVAAFLEHPSFARAARALQDIGGALGMVALVVAAVIPGTDVIAAPVLLGLAGAEVAVDGVAAAKHETTWTDVALGGLSLGLAGAGEVLGRGAVVGDKFVDDAFVSGDVGGTASLLTGVDARASGASLWASGVKSLFSVEDLKAAASRSAASSSDWAGTFKAVPGRVGSDVRQFLHFGADGQTHSPAVITFRRLRIVSHIAQSAADALRGHLAQEGPPQ